MPGGTNTGVCSTGWATSGNIPPLLVCQQTGCGLSGFTGQPAPAGRRLFLRALSSRYSPDRQSIDAALSERQARIRNSGRQSASPIRVIGRNAPPPPDGDSRFLHRAPAWAIRPCHSMIPIRRSHACVPSASPGISIPTSSGRPGTVMSSGSRSSGKIRGMCREAGVTA